MTNEELKNTLISLHPELEFPEIASQNLNIQCSASSLLNIAQRIKENEALKLDFLFSLTALDWPEDMEVIYHLRSTEFGHEIVLRVKTGNRDNPEVPCVRRQGSRTRSRSNTRPEGEVSQ